MQSFALISLCLVSFMKTLSIFICADFLRQTCANFSGPFYITNEEKIKKEEDVYSHILNTKLLTRTKGYLVIDVTYNAVLKHTSDFMFMNP